MNPVNKSPGFDVFSIHWKEWWPFAVFSAVALAIGTAVVVESRRNQVKSILDALKESHEVPSPGLVAFDRMLHRGVLDGELQYDQRRLKSRMKFDKSFHDARLLDISPMELAVRGRFFGAEVLPIRIEVYADGTTKLVDGRLRYLAAKSAGATAILADVVLYDGQGEIVAERQVAVRLL